MNLTFGWIRDEDIHAWAKLTNQLALIDDSDEFYTAEDLLEELLEPGLDPKLDTVAIWAADEMIGYGQIRVGQQLRDEMCRVSLGGGLLPAFRRQGLGTKLLEILEARGISKATALHPATALAFDMWGHSVGHGAGILAESMGYTVARYFQDMEITSENFRQETENWNQTENLRVLPFSEGYSERVRVLDNEAFSDHWGSTPKTIDEWNAMTSARTFSAERSQILVGEIEPNGPEQVLSYILASEWTPGELYVARVGTGRASRGKGYAAKLLSSVVLNAFSHGYTKADLSVDAQSPTGAVGLYQRLGFSVTRTGAMYRKIVSVKEIDSRMHAPSATLEHG
ncbi:hypothetical protein CQ018_14780 [Arthrobacter sp. MYb227]|uniref:GNAT family N-acetyltransferase n=1 Tax=Arthrobacter sp. MYb227 TaxID=1848601 RepID=UPI000CFE2838|nr:GNAT family N-acetyltransferase [Arthrobacter sp. MYb227]PQZ90258.1 hypothetical protein CQ018_14780 [Arthrobacter sp. MYb227]